MTSYDEGDIAVGRNGATTFLWTNQWSTPPLTDAERKATQEGAFKLAPIQMQKIHPEDDRAQKATQQQTAIETEHMEPRTHVFQKYYRARQGARNNDWTK